MYCTNSIKGRTSSRKSCLYILGSSLIPLKIYFKTGVDFYERKSKFHLCACYRIKNKADKCGLTISEYLRKRALGYSPKALLPESFYEFSSKLGDLYEQLNKGYSNELEERILSLIDEIQLKLLSTERKEFDE